MKFLSVFSKIGLNFSQLMGISSPASLIAAGSNQIQSPNNFFETIWAVILKTLEKLITSGIEIVVKLIYSIAKWMLTAVDFMFVIIRQMIGLNTDFSDIESLTTSDLIFKFIFNEQILDVIKSMIGYGILLIIVFSIFAIIKTEYAFITQGSGNSKKKVLSNALKSLFLMVLVPVLFIGGLILSNALARSLFIATSGGTDTSLGAQIFVTSSYDANVFRDYANNNLKIPITFNFEEVNKETDNVSGWGTDGNIAELDQALIDFKGSSVWNRGYATFMMFYIDTFLQMDEVDKIEWNASYEGINENSSYNYTYDENIYTTRDQYYVMADFIDHAMKSEQKFYYKTIEQVYNSYNALPGSVKESVKEQLPALTTNQIGKVDDDYYIEVSYKDFGYTDTKIVHKAGATSESDGAVFILAREVLILDENTIYSTYYPVLSNNFRQSNQGAGECVVARGLFSDEGYPTAIKQEDGVVKFYRDDLNIPTILDFFPTISYERPEGTTNAIPGLEIIKKGISGLTGVDVSQFIPYVYFSFDIFNLFSKQTYNIVTLEDGYLRLDFNFSQDGYVITNLYDLIDLNIVILIVSTVIIISMLLKIMFGLAHRIMDVTLLAISYPAVISTYPLDDGERFKNWTDNMIKKIINIYGVVIGLNLVLWMFPILDDLNLFTEINVENAIYGGLLSSRLGVGFLNSITELLFMLVAFTLLESATKMFETLITSSEASKSGILYDGTQTVNDLKAIPQKAANIISGKAFLEAGKELAGTAASFIPGSAIVKRGIEDVQDKYNAIKKAQEKVYGKSAQKDIENMGKDMAKELGSKGGSGSKDSLTATSSGGGGLGSSGSDLGSSGSGGSGTRSLPKFKEESSMLGNGDRGFSSSGSDLDSLGNGDVSSLDDDISDNSIGDGNSNIEGASDNASPSFGENFDDEGDDESSEEVVYDEEIKSKVDEKVNKKYKKRTDKQNNKEANKKEKVDNSYNKKINNQNAKKNKIQGKLDESETDVEAHNSDLEKLRKENPVSRKERRKKQKERIKAASKLEKSTKRYKKTKLKFDKIEAKGKELEAKKQIKIDKIEAKGRKLESEKLLKFETLYSKAEKKKVKEDLKDIDLKEKLASEYSVDNKAKRKADKNDDTIENFAKIDEKLQEEKAAKKQQKIERKAGKAIRKDLNKKIKDVDDVHAFEQKMKEKQEKTEQKAEKTKISEATKQYKNAKKQNKKDEKALRDTEPYKREMTERVGNLVNALRFRVQTGQYTDFDDIVSKNGLQDATSEIQSLLGDDWFAQNQALNSANNAPVEAVPTTPESPAISEIQNDSNSEELSALRNKVDTDELNRVLAEGYAPDVKAFYEKHPDVTKDQWQKLIRDSASKGYKLPNGLSPETLLKDNSKKSDDSDKK